MKLVSVIATIVLAGALSHAADAEKKSETTVDTSKNIITGTKKTVKKTKMAMKNASGDSSEAKVTETTKVKKDVTVQQKVEATVDANKKSH